MQSPVHVREGHCLLSLCVGENTVYTRHTTDCCFSKWRHSQRQRGEGDDGTFLKSTTPYFRFLFLFTIEEICVHVNGRFLEWSSFVFCHFHLARAMLLYVRTTLFIQEADSLWPVGFQTAFLAGTLLFWLSLCPFGFHYALLSFNMPFWLSLYSFGFHYALLAFTLSFCYTLAVTLPFGRHYDSLGTSGSHILLLFGSHTAFLAVILPFW
jgi:hypothetical protein